MAYRKSLPRGEFAQWVEREFEALERAVGGTSNTSAASEITGTVSASTNADNNRVKVFTASTNTFFVIEPASVQRLPPGATISFYQEGTGVVNLVAGTGVTLVSRPGLQSAGQHAFFSVWQKELDYWVAYGDLVPSTSSAVLPGTAAVTMTALAPTIS